MTMCLAISTESSDSRLVSGLRRRGAKLDGDAVLGHAGHLPLEKPHLNAGGFIDEDRPIAVSLLGGDLLRVLQKLADEDCSAIGLAKPAHDVFGRHSEADGARTRAGGGETSGEAQEERRERSTHEAKSIEMSRFDKRPAEYFEGRNE